jgi:glycosyltransferase involved in cell wall biosynthesis
VDRKTEVITNGYDESDFKEVPKIVPKKFTITYVGTLSDIYPIEGLIPALKNLQSSETEFVLRFVGTVSEKTKKLLQSEIPENCIEFLPYVIHSEAIKHMMGSSLLVLIIPLHQSNKSIITGKIFEYLATGKPILCLGPVEGDAAEIIGDCKAGKTFAYYDTIGISEFVTNARIRPELSDENAINRFSRLNLAKRIVGVLESNENIL